jgi:hypothetical protein
MGFANEAGWDRAARIAVGIVLLYLGWAGIVTGGWGAFFKLIGFAPLATGLIGWCPLYALFQCRTNGQPSEDVRVA